MIKQQRFESNIQYTQITDKVMSMFTCGKLLIAVGICLQAYTLCKDQVQINEFNRHLKAFLSHCESIPNEFKQLLTLNLRFVIIGFLSCSSLMAIFRTGLLKFCVLLGLVLRLVINFQLQTGSISLYLKNKELLYQLAIIGGVIYMMGAEPCRRQKPKEPQLQQKSIQKPQPKRTAQKPQKNK